MNKISKIIIGSLVLLTLSGCTDYKKIDKEYITDPDTDIRVVENITCKTEQLEKDYQELKDIETTKLMDKLNSNEITKEQYDTKLNEVNEAFNIDDVVSCSEFSVLDGKNSLWETLFVKPLSWILLQIGEFTSNYAIAIIAVTALIRLALFPITKKTAMQSENMAAAKNKLTKLEEKYRNKTDRDAQMMKTQEMMKIYKEYNINPMSGCLYAFIQIPLFFAFYEALYRTPVIFEESFLGLNLGLNPWTAFSIGQWYYIIIPILVVVATYFSFKLNKTTNPVGAQADQMKMMMKISVGMISIASFSVYTAIAIYWITNSSFTIIQNLIVKKEKKNADIL